VTTEARAIRIRSSGVTLAGHLAAPSSAARARPALVLCHGFPLVGGASAYAEATLPALAERITTTNDWVALSFAFRGCGDSEGDFSLGGWLDDVAAAVDHVASLPEVDGVWLAGFGTGGALALCAASIEERVRGVAALASPADFNDWAAHPRRLLEFAREVGVISTPGFPQDLDSWTSDLRRVRPLACTEALGERALIVVHGSDDTSVPVLDARVLADAHGAADLRIISGASHDLRLDPRAVAVLLGWLDRQWNRWQVTRGVMG
jgi:putative redox protein